MKRLFILLLALLFILPMSAQEIFTRDDFLPPPPEEKELFSEIYSGEARKNGLWLTGMGIAAGAVCSYAALQGVMTNALDNPYGTDLQTGIIVTGTGLAFTAFFAVIHDGFRDSREPFRSISEE